MYEKNVSLLLFLVPFVRWNHRKLCKTVWYLSNKSKYVILSFNPSLGEPPKTTVLHMSWFCRTLFWENVLNLNGAFSKWLDVFDMGYIKSNTLIDCLLALFCIHGLPYIIVTDIGPSFVSSEFKEFYRKNRVKHVTLVPYNLSLNSASKNVVQTFKYTMRKSF